MLTYHGDHQMVERAAAPHEIGRNARELDGTLVVEVHRAGRRLGAWNHRDLRIEAGDRPARDRLGRGAAPGGLDQIGYARARNREREDHQEHERPADPHEVAKYVTTRLHDQHVGLVTHRRREREVAADDRGEDEGLGGARRSVARSPARPACRSLPPHCLSTKLVSRPRKS